MDPLLSLAFSVQSNKGVYALLLGSGISRSASIPTGWEIVIELVRKLALISEETCEPDPVTWYEEKFGHEPGYAELLDKVAKTSAERQQLLRAYFEPTVAEQEDKLKQPTAAHHAIAQLVANGYIRVIITTNFDRLMEQALQQAGVEPQVIASPDQIEGALPLAHAGCFVIKVHGDYLDARLKNTPEELEAYDPRLNVLLDQVLDQFGLITCGWSADWDVALRNAIERAPSRRFTTYWTSRGAPSETASTLVQHRKGQLISITDADHFFTRLQEKVEALEKFSEPHPLSIHTLLATTKKYLSEDRYRIRLYDLIDEETTRVIKQLNGSGLGNINHRGNVGSADITTQVRKYDAACKSLVAMAAVCGQWGSVDNINIWQRVQQRFYSATGSNGNVLLLEYQRYPISLITYACCLGSTLPGNFELILGLVTTNFKKPDCKEQAAIEIVPPFCMLSHAQDGGRLLEGLDKRYAPLNDWLHDVLLGQIGHLFSSAEEFTYAFDRVEILLALAFGAHGANSFQRTYRPPGSFGYRFSNREKIISEIIESLKDFENESPYITSGLIGDTADTCREQIRILNEFIGRLNWH
nr:SIR2 family protein [uncultured Undibacterium sp.]